mmetsp:Transcript_46515/g.113281  ORF Transcript_46515/g.113281 Transcript_46515/m.113281 type:complete len:895 (+) Transcript_46515:313-2997(+)
MAVVTDNNNDDAAPSTPPQPSRRRRRSRNQMTMITATPSPKIEMDGSCNISDAFPTMPSATATAAAAMGTDLNFLPSLIAGHRRRSVMTTVVDNNNDQDDGDIVAPSSSKSSMRRKNSPLDGHDHGRDRDQNGGFENDRSSNVNNNNTAVIQFRPHDDAEQQQPHLPPNFITSADVVGCGITESMRDESDAFPSLMGSISSLNFLEDGTSYIFSSQRRRVSTPPPLDSSIQLPSVRSSRQLGKAAAAAVAAAKTTSSSSPPDVKSLTPTPSFDDEEKKLDDLVLHTMSMRNQQQNQHRRRDIQDGDDGGDHGQNQEQNEQEQQQQPQPQRRWSLSPLKSLKGKRKTLQAEMENSYTSNGIPSTPPSASVDGASPITSYFSPKRCHGYSNSNSNSNKNISSLTSNRISTIPLRDADVDNHTTKSNSGRDPQQQNHLRSKSKSSHNFTSHALEIGAAGSTLRRCSSALSQVSDGGQTTHKIIVKRPYKVKEHYAESIFYVSVSAILGSVFRTYLARLFGYDCEEVKYFPEDAIHDFLTPLSSQICVTNGGRTIQTGGALFYDFPANILGSFIMGVITPRLSQPRTRLPWLHRDHDLQRDDVLHASLATGFCGCLTTFSSWNSQMVVMLDGTYCELGSQVVPVFFGYAIGLLGAFGAFHFGQNVGLWWYDWKHRDEPPIDLKASHSETSSEDNALVIQRRGSTHQPIELVHDTGSESGEAPDPNHFHKIPLFLVSAGLLVAFVVGDLKADIQWYKGMAMLWIFAPAGSLLRWRLSRLNVRSDQRLCKKLPRWVPWGTLTANLSAAAIGALLFGITDRYYGGTGHTSATISSPLVEASLFALTTGFAGSLSTVSTMVKEAVMLSEQFEGKGNSFYYQTGTCLCSMLIGLMVYATTIRV